MTDWKVIITLLSSIVLVSCGGSELTSTNSEIEVDVPFVTMPVTEVPVYPLGEPGLLSYFSKLERDSDGIILLDAHGNPSTYEPGMIAKYVMASYRNYKKNGNDSVIIDALKHTDWLVDNIHCDDKLGYWLLDAPLDNLVVWESPFKSAMTNGLSIFALAQMLTFTDEPDEYLATIECALKAYQYDISDNGVSSITDEYTWFEEYAMESRSKVLNGGIFALTGVWVAKKYLNSDIAIELFDKMLNAIELRIGEYDYVHTTLYHTVFKTGSYADFGRPVHGQYNEIHALQLQWLYSETGREFLLDYARKFYSYESHEIADVLKNSKALPKMVDSYKYHSFDVFTALDTLEIELKPAHLVKEVHLFYYGYHESLPGINLASENEYLENISVKEIKYFQDGPHHTSVGIYQVPANQLSEKFELSFNDYLYTDNYNRNLLRQVEVITDDENVYFDAKYERWANQGAWSRKYK